GDVGLEDRYPLLAPVEDVEDSRTIDVKRADQAELARAITFASDRRPEGSVGSQRDNAVHRTIRDEPRAIIRPRRGGDRAEQSGAVLADLEDRCRAHRPAQLPLRLRNR